MKDIRISTTTHHSPPSRLYNKQYMISVRKPFVAAALLGVSAMLAIITSLLITPTADAQFRATINGAPNSNERTNQIVYSFTVGGYGVNQYRWKLLQGSSCGSGPYLGVRDTSESIDVGIAAYLDGYMSLCVIGRGSTGGWQTSPTKATWIKDTVRPTLILTRSPGAYVSQEGSYRMTATFSEEVTGFSLSDVSIRDNLGTVSNLSVSPTNPKKYLFDYRPPVSTSSGSTVLWISENVAEDGAGNGNWGSYNVSIFWRGSGSTNNQESSSSNNDEGSSNDEEEDDDSGSDQSAPETTVEAPTRVDLKTTSDSGPNQQDDITTDNTPTITVFGVRIGATVTVTARKNGEDDVVGSATAYSQSVNIRLNTLADGVWLITAKQRTRGGLESSSTAPLPITIDTDDSDDDESDDGNNQQSSNTAPAAPLRVELKASSDTGASDSDGVTSEQETNRYRVWNDSGYYRCCDGAKIWISTRCCGSGRIVNKDGCNAAITDNRCVVSVGKTSFKDRTSVFGNRTNSYHHH